MMLDGFQSNIHRLVSGLGRDMTLKAVVNTGSFFDPAGVPVETTIKAAAFDYTVDEIDGTIIQAEDKEFVISGKGLTINKNDIIVDNSVEYRIVNLEKVAPGKENIFYIAQGRA
jgi:hypothetical protein